MEPFLGQVMGNGRYQLTHKVGEGGMATVYLARDIRLNLNVVVKKNSLSQTAADRQKFTDEATTMVKIGENPARPASLPIVRDFFIEPDGGQYLVMQYIEGEDLASLVERVGALDEKAVLYWLAQILDAIEFLHQQKPPIIHCDIKPHNIRISKDGKQAYLVDFGIANDQGGHGTPGYAPLEQYTGKVTVQSDIYALGATLYVLLSGTPPDDMVNFRADQRQQGTTTLPPLGSNVSTVLQTVVTKALELKANARYKTIADIRQQLQTILPAALSLPAKQAIQLTLPKSLSALGKCSVRETAFWFVNAERRPARLALGRFVAPQPVILPVAHGSQVEFWQIPAWQRPGLRLNPPPPAIHGDDVTAVVIDNNGRFAATASRDHKIQLWDMLNRQPKLPTITTPSWLRAITFHPAGNSVTGIGDNQQIWRWAIQHPATPQLLGSDVNGRCLTYSPNGRWLVVAGEQNRLWVRDEQDGRVTELTLTGNATREWLQTAVFRSDSSLLVVGGSGGRLHFLHTTDGKSTNLLPPDQWIEQIAGHSDMGHIYAMAMSPDGRFLAMTGANKYLYIFNTIHGQLVNHPFPLDGAGLSLQFGATWQYLALGMSNGRVSLLWLY